MALTEPAALAKAARRSFLVRRSLGGGASEGGHYAYVYLIRSKSSPDQTYIGSTDNLKRRLQDHNSGDSPHTPKYRP